MFSAESEIDFRVLGASDGVVSVDRSQFSASRVRSRSNGRNARRRNAVANRIGVQEVRGFRVIATGMCDPFIDSRPALRAGVNQPCVKLSLDMHNSSFMDQAEPVMRV
jgi:hypothetical protein